jgi:hypothetical protein
MEWIGKSSWEESKAFLEEHDNQMVSPLGLDIIQRVAQAMPEEPVIQKHLLVLTRVMSLGIDETYKSIRPYWQ